MDHFEFGGAIAWRPTPEQIAYSRLGAFIRKHGLSSLDELLARSTTDLEWFWRAVLDDLGIEFYEPYSRVLDLSRGIARPCMVRRRTDEHRPQLPREVDGHADRASPGAALGRRGRHHAHADVRGAAARRESRGRRTARARRQARRPRGAVHADVPGARRRVLRRDQDRWHRAAAVLRLRRGRRDDAAAGRWRQGADHRGRLLAARPGRADERGRRRGSRRRRRPSNT